MKPLPPKSTLFPYTTLFRSSSDRDRLKTAKSLRALPLLCKWVNQKLIRRGAPLSITRRSEEHTSELQSRGHLVCRHLLEKKNKIKLRSKQSNHKDRSKKVLH